MNFKRFLSNWYHTRTDAIGQFSVLVERTPMLNGKQKQYHMTTIYVV